jgi:predicted  nucleic acid-binding Zn-ribbon protein
MFGGGYARNSIDPDAWLSRASHRLRKATKELDEAQAEFDAAVKAVEAAEQQPMRGVFT